MFKSARFVPFWFIMSGFAPSKLRVPKLSILIITVTIFAPSPYLKFFHKATDHSSTPFSFCNYCNRKGHSTSTCTAKKHGANSSYKWVPKGTKATKDPPPRKETKGGQGSRAWKQSSRKAQEPRANTRPEAQINHKPKVKTNTGPRALGTNDRGPKKDWVTKLV